MKTKTPRTLLTDLEALAADAYNSGEHEFSFCLAAFCGAYQNGLLDELAHSVCNYFGERTRSAILEKVADEAQRASSSEN